jgi:hypothetical protein
MDLNQNPEVPCAICDQPIKLEMDRHANDAGKSMHETCYQPKLEPVKKRPARSFGESKFDCRA